MKTKDERLQKRHWHLAVWSIPQVGTYVPVSVFAWSQKRAITVPELTAARNQRQVPEGAVLVNVAYIGLMNQFELTGLSPDPVPTTTTPAYTMGLEQTMSVPDPTKLVNAFPEEDQFNHTEWALGNATGITMRTKIISAATTPPPQEEISDVR